MLERFRMSDILLSRDDILNVDPDLLPMPCFSDCLRSFFATAIKEHTDGEKIARSMASF